MVFLNKWLFKTNGFLKQMVFFKQIVKQSAHDFKTNGLFGQDQNSEGTQDFKTNGFFKQMVFLNKRFKSIFGPDFSRVEPFVFVSGL